MKRILALAVVVVVLASCWGVKVDPSSSPVVPPVKVVRETMVVEKVVTATPASTVAVIPAVVSESVLISDTQVVVGSWEITYFPGATEEMREWQFAEPAPEKWPTFPNEPNPLVPEFRVKIVDDVETVPDGLEYGIDESDFCQTMDGRCRFPVAARHYRIITADYDINGIGKCACGDDKVGCALMIINVGEVTSAWEGFVDMGFTVTGSYFNGDVLNEAIVAGLSYTANRMMNLANPEATNEGSNCSSPEGCDGVNMTFFVCRGKEILMRGKEVASR